MSIVQLVPTPVPWVQLYLQSVPTVGLVPTLLAVLCRVLTVGLVPTPLLLE